MKTIELVFEGDPPPELKAGGAVIRLDPVIGESGKVAAYRVIDDESGAVVTVIPATAVRVVAK